MVSESLVSTPCLTHYDLDLPLVLACDASSYSVGAVLSHVFNDGSEHPIAFANTTLSTAQRNYSQIERESFSIIFEAKTFHQFIYGSNFTLLTDHKPLVTIFGSTAEIPPMAASRLQRWAIILSAYQYDVKHIRGEGNCNADGLSRLPLPDATFDCSIQGICELVNRVQSRILSSLPINSDQVSKKVHEDPVMVKVCSMILNGWPDKSTQLPATIRRFWVRPSTTAVLMGYRVVIPTKLQPRILQELHASHSGIVRMNAMARSYFWWPGIDNDIEDLGRACVAYQSISANLPSHRLPCLDPQGPWTRLHLDFAGPFNGWMWLISVDAATKWPDVFRMKTTTTDNTIQQLQFMFARFGLPKEVVTDNGPQFTSEVFVNYCSANGIKHILTPPYHPRSNGLAERFVRSSKEAVNTTASEIEGNLLSRIS